MCKCQNHSDDENSLGYASDIDPSIWHLETAWKLTFSGSRVSDVHWHQLTVSTVSTQVWGQTANTYVIIVSDSCWMLFRYKMTCEYTWPNHLMASDREAVEAIVIQHGFQDDVAYGQTKLFVRTPRSLFTLEQERNHLIPILVTFLQKVRHESVTMLHSWFNVKF